MKSNFCANCGEKLDSSVNFCPACGHVSETLHGIEGEILNEKHSTKSVQKDIVIAGQVLIYGICGIYAVYTFFICTLLLITIFKFSVVAGILMFVVGGLGVGLLYSPVWILAMGAFGVVTLTGMVKNSLGRFFLPIILVPLLFGISYIWLWVVAYLVNAVIS